MNINDETEIKKEFQLERVIFFSDAVFAIIITIMVLDIRLPEGLRHASATQAKQASSSYTQSAEEILPRKNY